MKKSIFIAVLAGLVSIMSCNTDDISCKRVSSEIVTGQKTLTGYDGIVFSAVGDVWITQGTEYSFSMQGPKNVIEALTTEIVGSDLLICSSACFNGTTGDNQLTLKITMPVIRSLEMSGTGNMKSFNTLKGDHISICFYGVGSLNVDAEADSINLEITGTGAIRLTGAAHKHNIIYTGVAELETYGLVTDTTVVLHRGTGNCHFFVNDILDVNLLGTGNVYFKGNPVVEQHIEGTGKVIDAN